ncbi:MAG: SH3 domain-containing protein [Caldilineaceae bacterium SB0661_bin_32]|uniref:SH3 domain-containing protein n=1 Tax=Caldilineaceae bacterium SB0661_bin_32 TaxID=2605255 RepID=A0A6B1D893_9CHLR|nr:SH3 domain-containing protein [Caldilineaceae bacterium SB0661_bin_32]
MTANCRSSFRAIVTVAALLLTACNAIIPESDRPVSATARAAPLLSIHNPLVFPVGDTPTNTGGPFYGWPAVEVESHGIRVFLPHRWLFASSLEALLALRPQLGDNEMADAFLEERQSYLNLLTPTGQERLFAGTGFPFDPDAQPVGTNGFHLLAVPSEGRTLETYAQHLTEQLEASGFASLARGEVGPGLRPWGEQTATIRYGIDAAQAYGERAVTVPDAVVDGWMVVLLSPDNGTFLTVAFDSWGDSSEWWELLHLEIVRRIQWTADPAYRPRTGPTVTLNFNMNVRAGPSTDHPIVGKASVNEQFAVISSNAAGDWWQIEYNGQLGWLHRAYVTASADTDTAPQADETGWLTANDSERGFSLSYPPGWRYFDPARPTQADLALFAAASRTGSGDIDAPGLAQTVSDMSYRRDDAVIGLGLQSGPPESEASNFMLVFSFPSNGVSLESYAEEAAGHAYSLSPATVQLAQGLGPANGEAVSIRYHEHGTNSEVWQIWLLSPDGETLLALAFSVHSDQFEALEPLLREIVERLTWIER